MQPNPIQPNPTHPQTLLRTLVLPEDRPRGVRDGEALLLLGLLAAKAPAATAAAAAELELELRAALLLDVVSGFVCHVSREETPPFPSLSLSYREVRRGPLEPAGAVGGGEGRLPALRLPHAVSV